MRTFCSILLVLLFCSSAAAQNYAVGRIPEELKARASAVVRLSETRIEIKDLDMMIYKVKRAVTILNKNGDADAAIHLSYDKSRQIKSIKGLIYNEMGIPEAKISEKNFKDESAADGSLFSDSRIKRLSPAKTVYPYTIEYEFEIRWKQTLVLPDWMPIRYGGIALENACLTLVCKPDFKLRYKELNYPGTVETDSDKNGNITYTWKLSNLKAYRDEPYSPYPETYLPSVK